MISCKTCGWRHGADHQPTQCPPECEVCGVRHGSNPNFMRKKKLPAVCRRKEDHPDGAKHDNYAFDVEPRKKQIPLGAKKGRAMAAGNNCLIHTLLQHATGTPWTAGNEKDCAKKCAAVRRALVSKHKAPEDGLLDLQEWWGPILRELGVDSSNVCISCHTSMDGSGQAVVHGSGDDVYFLAQEGFNHFVPIWRKPVAAKRSRNPAGARGNKGATLPASAEEDGNAVAATTSPQGKDATPRDQEARARTYRNHAWSYANRHPDAPPEEIWESINRNFESAAKIPEAAAAAATAVAVSRKAKLQNLEEKIREYGKGARASAYVGAQMFLKGYPQSAAVEVVAALSRLWGKPLCGAQTGQVEKALSAYAAMKNGGQQYGEEKEKRTPEAARNGGNAADDSCSCASEGRSSASHEEERGGAGTSAQGGGPGDLTRGAERLGRIVDFLRGEASATSTGRYKRLRNLRRAAAPYSLKEGNLYHTDGQGRTRRVCVTAKERQEALHLAHDAAVAGHYKAQNTWNRLKSAAFWPGYAQDAFHYAFTCLTRQLRSSTDMKAPAPMRTIPYPTRPFRLVACDLKKLPESALGNMWLAVAVCHSTKFVEAGPLADKQASTAASFLFREVFARYGYVRYMLTDRGAEFRNEVAGCLAEKLGISPRYTAPYHPQGNGTCERMVGVVAERLAKTVGGRPDTWDAVLPAALMAMRTTTSASTGYAPLALLTCRDFVTPIQVELSGAYHIDEDDLRTQEAREDANRKAADNGALELGDFVKNYERICDPKLPFYLQDESEEEYAEAAQAGGGLLRGPRQKHARERFEEDRVGAKKMRLEAKENVAKKVAANKKHYDKRRLGGGSGEAVVRGSRILVRDGQFAARMHGRLAFKFRGPFVVKSVQKRKVKYTDGSGALREADIDNVKPFKER